jgi:hypothetical protein
MTPDELAELERIARQFPTDCYDATTAEWWCDPADTGARCAHCQLDAFLTRVKEAVA